MGDELKESDKDMPTESEDRPSWRVQVKYSNHTAQDISNFSDCLSGCPEELYFALLKYFEIDEEKMKNFLIEK